MQTDLVRTFVTVAETGSLTRAARQLGLSQPSVSGHISLLERRLGCRLIERGHGTATLTPAGSELLPSAEALLSAEADFLAAGSAAGGGSAGGHQKS